MRFLPDGRPLRIADPCLNQRPGKQKIAIKGASTGGFLMGAVLTPRPDLFRAAVSFAGIYDMLQVELTSNGVFNITEFGSVKNAD